MCVHVLVHLNLFVNALHSYEYLSNRVLYICAWHLCVQIGFVLWNHCLLEFFFVIYGSSNARMI